jgi:hypothetical protein
MKEQHKSRYCSRSWDAFEVDYTPTAAPLCSAGWDVNLAAVLGAALDMELPAFTNDKASRPAVAVDVDCSFSNKRYRDLDLLKERV